MPIRFNHTIIPARDKGRSASFFTDVFGLSAPQAWGPFLIVELADGVFVQFAEPGIDFPRHHYAFLVGDSDFDRLLVRLDELELEYWADPRQSTLGINTNHGGRGVYFRDPSDHGLEAITRPYAADGQGR
jgi:catechol 2,3-dioxygenase-like lactoylglutathione lyase family enzyme